MGLYAIVDGVCKECVEVVAVVKSSRKNLLDVNTIINGVDKNIFSFDFGSNIGGVYIKLANVKKAEYDYSTSKVGTSSTLAVSNWKDYVTMSYDVKNNLWYFCVDSTDPGTVINMYFDIYITAKNNPNGAAYAIDNDIFDTVPLVTLNGRYSSTKTSRKTLKTCSKIFYIYDASGNTTTNLLSGSTACNTGLSAVSYSITGSKAKAGYYPIQIALGSVNNSATMTGHLGRYLGMKITNFQVNNFVGFPTIKESSGASVYKATWATKVIDHFELFPVFTIGGYCNSSSSGGSFSTTVCYEVFKDTIELSESSTSDFHKITASGNTLYVTYVKSGDSSNVPFVMMGWDIRAVYEDGSTQRLSDIPNGSWLTHIAYHSAPGSRSPVDVGTSEDGLLPGPYREFEVDGVTYEVPDGFKDRYGVMRIINTSASTDDNSYELLINTYTFGGKTFKYLGVLQNSKRLENGPKISIQKVFYMGYPYDCTAVLN